MKLKTDKKVAKFLFFQKNLAKVRESQMAKAKRGKIHKAEGLARLSSEGTSFQLESAFEFRGKPNDNVRSPLF